MSRSYSIGAVSRLTGLSTARIRAWETRYRAVIPPRTASGRRIYDDATLKRLQLLAQVSGMGHGISRIASLSEKDLRRFIDVSNDHNSRIDVADIVPDLVALIRRKDWQACCTKLANAFVNLDPWRLVNEVLTPLLRDVDLLCARHELSVGKSIHLATYIRSRLCANLHMLPITRSDPNCIFATLSGERHDLGSLMACYLTRSTGIWGEFVGTGFTPADIVDIAVETRCAVTIVSVTQPLLQNDSLTLFTELHDRLPDGVALWIRGRYAHEVGKAIPSDNVVIIDSTDGLRDELDKLVHH